MEKIKHLNIGTLNVRGRKEKHQLQTVAKDAVSYNLQILGITETHFGNEGLYEIKEGTQEYIAYMVGTNIHHGIGLVIAKELNPKFRKIADRICTAIIKTDKTHQIRIICAYAPTMEVSEKHQDQRETFYEQLDNEIGSSSQSIILIGDFNEKTGSGHQEFKENVGKYGNRRIKRKRKTPTRTFFSPTQYLITN